MKPKLYNKDNLKSSIPNVELMSTHSISYKYASEIEEHDWNVGIFIGQLMDDAINMIDQLTPSRKQ